MFGSRKKINKMLDSFIIAVYQKGLTPKQKRENVCVLAETIRRLNEEEIYDQDKIIRDEDIMNYNDQEIDELMECLSENLIKHKV